MSDVIDLTTSVNVESSSDEAKESLCDLCGPEPVIASKLIDFTRERQDSEAESDQDSTSDEELLLDVAKERQNRIHHKAEAFSIYSISDSDSDEGRQDEQPGPDHRVQPVPKPDPAPGRDARERMRAARLQELVNERPKPLRKAPKQLLLNRRTRLEQKILLPQRPLRRNNRDVRPVRKMPPAPRASACSAPSWASPTGNRSKRARLEAITRSAHMA